MGQGNAMKYVVGGIVVLLLGGFFMMRGSSSVVPGYDVATDLGGATTYSDNKGNTATVGGGSMPDNWPTDVPQNFAGATIQVSGSSNPQTGKAGATVTYSAQGTAQAVLDYYKSGLTASGWAIVTSANVGGAMALSATKDTRTFGVYIIDAGEGMVTVTASLEL